MSLAIRDSIGAPTGRGVLVAVIDSGWDCTQPDPRVIAGVGLVDPADDLMLHYSDDYHDRLGHGTACARIILERAPDAEIFPLRVFGRRLETSVTQLQAALRLASERGARVISLSLATLRQDIVVPLYAACEHVCDGGALVVAAAYAPTGSGYPAVFANAIGVEAGDVPRPFDYCYRSEAAIECVVRGTPPAPDLVPNEQADRRSNSFAAARLAGILATFLEARPRAHVEEARLWLAEHGSRA